MSFSYFYNTLSVRDYVEACYSRIIPGLYLSNARAAADLRVLRRLGITHVLTVDSHRLPNSVFAGSNISTLFIRAGDYPETQLLPYFPMSNTFIDQGLRSGNVLVHCHRGISRSPTLVIAYLMKRYEYTYEQAYKHVERRRRFINPNAGFVEQLKIYQELGYDVKGFSPPEISVQLTLHKYKTVTYAVAVLCGILVLVVLYFLWL